MQKSVGNSALATVAVGEFYTDGDRVTRGMIINSASEANNVIGRVLTQVADEDDQAGVAASSIFAGILCSPKSLVRATLDPQSTVPNGTPVEVAKRGFIGVNLPATADIGDFVYYSDTTGELSTAAPNVAPAVGTTRVPGGTVEYFNVAAAGVAVIYVDFSGDTTVGAP